MRYPVNDDTLHPDAVPTVTYSTDGHSPIVDPRGVEFIDLQSTPSIANRLFFSGRYHAVAVVAYLPSEKGKPNEAGEILVMDSATGKIGLIPIHALNRQGKPNPLIKFILVSAKE